MTRLIPKWYIRYKFFNSLFLGLSVGAIFTIYAPLDPSIYSLGGIALAVGMLTVARLYHKILNVEWFFRISLLVEVVLLLAIVYFLIYPYTYETALLVYLGYQVTFVFGSYLLRAETLIIQTDALLTTLDTLKQLGYLVGMGVSYLLYQILEQYSITANQDKVYTLHYLLLGVEMVIIVLILLSFSTTDTHEASE
jgi:hypothetical protein